MSQELRTLVRGMYDLQKLRVSTGNRIVGTFKVKLGQAPGESEAELKKEGKEVLSIIRQVYENMTDGAIGMLKSIELPEDGVIDNHTEFALVAQYMELEKMETDQVKRIKYIIENEPLWDAFFDGVKGCGPLMAGVIMSEIDIHKAKYVSSIWRYAGLDVASDGKGRSRKKEHLEESEYKAADGTMKKKMGITFNPFLKTKLVGVLGSSFIKAGKENNKYADVYYNYKHRLENHAVYKDTTKGHRHNMAIRYMVKMFLQDLYVAWRTIEGLPVHDPYPVAKLGMKAHAAA